MGRYGKGWKPNVRPFVHLFSGVHQLSKAAIALPFSDLTPYTAPLMDQGDTSTCTGHAMSDGIYTSMGAVNTPLPWVPSQAGIYVIGNAVTRAAAGNVGQPLVDEGAYPSDVAVGMAQWGIRPMGPLAEGRFSDASSVTCVAEPDLDQLEVDAATAIECHAVMPGENLVGDACAALVKYAMPTGIFVDTAFEEWDPLTGFVGAPVNPNDPNGGGHYVDVVGFVQAGVMVQNGGLSIPPKMKATPAQTEALVQAATKLPAKDPLFFVKNSWNTWGLNGYFIATKAWLMAPSTSDCNAVIPNPKKVT